MNISKLNHVCMPSPRAVSISGTPKGALLLGPPPHCVAPLRSPRWMPSPSAYLAASMSGAVPVGGMKGEGMGGSSGTPIGGTPMGMSPG